MGYAAHRGADSHSHVLGSGVSIAAHVLILSLLLFTVSNPPRSADAPGAPITPLDLRFVQRDALGPIGGSGSGAASERARRPQAPEPAAQQFTPIERPVDVMREITMPVAALDAPNVLPGSAVEIDPAAVGRGAGPGTSSGRGAGPGSNDGPGTGVGREGWGEGFDVGNGVAAPQLVHEVKPGYTANALRAKVQGQVELEVVVLPDGTVDPKRIRLVRSLDALFGLDGQAIDAVKQWRFRPGTYRNQPVPVRVRVELTFTLR